MLHLSWMCFWAAASTESHRERQPQHLELAGQIAHEGLLADVSDGDVVDAMTALWPRLIELSPPA